MLQLVLYKNNEHLDTDFFDDLPRALVAVQEAKGYSDSFSIYPDDGSETLTGYIEGNVIHIHEM